MHSPTMRLVITVLVVLGAAGTWSDKGREQLTLPTVDLPAARSGVVLRHSPRFEITPVTGGTFRVETDGGPFTATLRDSVPIPADRSRDEVAQRIAPSPRRFRRAAAACSAGRCQLPCRCPSSGAQSFSPRS